MQSAGTHHTPGLPLSGAGDPMVPEFLRVVKFRKETSDTFTLELKRDSGEPFSFKPGQFNMLYVFGVGEVPISISGDPGKSETLVHTIREVGAVTTALRKLRAGDQVGVRGPFGTSWPVEKVLGEDVVIVAGGIGLAPLRPAMYEVLSRRGKFGKVFLLYGARTSDDILFRKELEEWRSRFDLEVEVTVDRADGSWLSHVGVVTQLIKRAEFDPIQTAAFICGPEVMIRFSALELETRGVSHDRIQISMERNMKCGVGICGHCQLGPGFVCKNGPVYSFREMRPLMNVREL